MVLKQMRNEALDMLVLWAASQDYSPVSGHTMPDPLRASLQWGSQPWQLTTIPPCSRLLCMPCVLQEIEEVLKRWASTFGIPDTELNERIMAAASGQLSRPCSASANVRQPCFGFPVVQQHTRQPVPSISQHRSLVFVALSMC
jgi:hypothetical protein